MESELKQDLEALLGISAYPFTIPQSANLPAILYKEISSDRDSDSNLSEVNIKQLVYQVTIVTKAPVDNINFKNIVQDRYDNFSGYLTNDRKYNILISRILQCIPLYDSNQRTYEYNIDISFKVNLK